MRRNRGNTIYHEMRKHDGLRKIIIIRYDIDHLLKFAKKKRWGRMGGDSQHFRGSARNDKKTFYLNNKIMRSLPPERGINIVCLFISAGVSGCVGHRPNRRNADGIGNRAWTTRCNSRTKQRKRYGAKYVLLGSLDNSYIQLGRLR